MANKISAIRMQKMQAQGGLCYYCGQPMWAESPEVFRQVFGVPPRKAWLFHCTAEHLLPRIEGGPDEAGNIVAACWYCNQTRHRARKPLSPSSYRAHVRKRLKAGRWQRLSGPNRS